YGVDNSSVMTLRTGQLAQLADVNVETLRFYERAGILPAPPRRASGYREFPADAVALVRFVQRAQKLGFSLAEIKTLLAFRETPTGKCRSVCALAQRKLDEIDAKISDLKAMRRVLARLLIQCPGTGPVSQCRIIESLNGTQKRRLRDH